MRDRPPHHLLLLDDLRSKIRARHLSLRTEQAYASWAERYIRFHRGRHPARMGAAEIDAFLTLPVGTPRSGRLDPQPGRQRASVPVP
jgi:hypothetical protein